jgi:prepilin-type processing-associated H-X9-DG protein
MPHTDTRFLARPSSRISEWSRITVSIKKDGICGTSRSNTTALPRYATLFIEKEMLCPVGAIKTTCAYLYLLINLTILRKRNFMETCIKDNCLRQISSLAPVELVVVIAIIGISILLFLPAIQQARESARDPQCINHPNNLNMAFCDGSLNSLPC